MGDTPKRQSVKGAFVWSFLEQGGAKAINLLVQIVLARLLAPEAFGVLAILLVVIEMANVIAQSGLGLALIQRDEITETAYSTALWLSLGLAFALYIILFLSAPLIAEFYAMIGLALYLRVIAFAVITNAISSIQRACLQSALDFKALFKANILAIALSGIAGIGAAIAGLGVWALVAQVLTQSVVACIVLSAFLKRRPKTMFDFEDAKSLFSYGWKICVTGILNVIYTGTSELIIGKACSAVDLGYYSQGNKWPNAAITVASNAMQNVMFPAFSKLKGDMAALRSAMVRMIDVGSFVVVPLSLLFAVVAEPLVVVLLTEKWLPCVPVFQLICVANVMLMPQLVNLRAYMALGDSGLYLRLQIVKVVIGTLAIGATALLTRNIYCVALATCLFTFFAVIVVDMQPARRKHGVGRGDQLRIIAPSVLLSLVASALAYAVSLLALPPIALLCIQVIVFAAVYVAGAIIAHLNGLVECVSMVRSLMHRPSSSENAVD